MKSGERVGKSVSMLVEAMRELGKCVMVKKDGQSILSHLSYRYLVYLDTTKRWIEVQIEPQVKA